MQGHHYWPKQLACSATPLVAFRSASSEF